MAKPASLVPEGRHIQIKIQQLAEYFHGFIPAAPQCRWITCQSRTRQLPPFIKRFIEDKSDFALNPANLRVQIGRQNAGRIGVIRRDWALKRAGGKLAYANLTRWPNPRLNRDRCLERCLLRKSWNRGDGYG